MPRVVTASLFAVSLDPEALHLHIQTAEDTEYLRSSLTGHGLVAFIADDAILPRKSGVDARPLDSENVVCFNSPESLRIGISLPNAGQVTGMGIPRGVTLLVGGGYHGKSTLLQAIEQGVYNHISGDGRESCVSLSETVKVRAYSGRSVVHTDISPFIGNIPGQQDTVSFSSPNASGSTSQAAFISEAIEAGAQVLLIDEDTSATNFLIRDGRMQQLVKKEHEPITAFIDRVRQLHEEYDISTILVLGGSGDYLGVADHIIQMIEYRPNDVTEEARRIVAKNLSGRVHEGHEKFEIPRNRCPLADGLDTRNEFGHRRVYAPNPHQLVYGKMNVDLTDVEQLLDSTQTKAIGLAIEYARQYMDGKTMLKDIMLRVISEIREHGLDVLDPKFTGDLAAFRDFEFAAVLNRMRDVRICMGENSQYILQR